MNQKIKWPRRRSCMAVPALLSLAAALGLSACGTDPSRAAMKEMAETEQISETGINSEIKQNSKPDAQTEAATKTAGDASAFAHLSDTLKLMRIQYGKEFSFAWDISKLAPDEVRTDAGTEHSAGNDMEYMSETNMASAGKNDIAPEENTAESDSEPTAADDAKPSVANEAAAPAALRILKDYRELNAFPLPPIPMTIRTLEARLTGLTESYSGRWSVYVKNLTTGDTFIINDTPMKSASVMKLFIMGTVYEAIRTGGLERTQEVVDLLNNMISYSSNSDSNRLLSLLGDGDFTEGIEKVNQYIASQNYSGETHEYNGFNDASTILDSEHSNQVSAKDCGALLEQVYHRTFGSRQICNEVEAMMLKQDTRYKIPAGLPEGVEVGNKTGEMDTVENDIAIIYGEKSDYILCVLSGDWNSKDEAISHIAEISSVTYEFFDSEEYYEYAAGTDETLAEYIQPGFKPGPVRTH